MEELFTASVPGKSAAHGIWTLRFDAQDRSLVATFSFSQSYWWKTSAVRGLNEDHKKHLLITMEHLDESLTSIEHILDSKPSSPFDHFIRDITPDQNELITKRIAVIRQLMAYTLKRLDIPLREPRKSALRMIDTSLVFMELTLMETGVKNILGFGEISEEWGVVLDEMMGEIRKHPEKLRLDLQTF
ncbi:MAG: hypothetical protein GX443_03055 [Deltaproteobacteria bacterium]|nr:hypothetical protein [Deltaproteobacteria bacterium]